MKHYTAALCLLSYLSVVAQPIADFGPTAASNNPQEHALDSSYRCGCLTIEETSDSRRHTIPKSEQEERKLKEAGKQLAAHLAKQQQQKKND